MAQKKLVSVRDELQLAEEAQRKLLPSGYINTARRECHQIVSLFKTFPRRPAFFLHALSCCN